MVVFSLFFGRLARMPSDGMPYPLFIFAALVPWTFFAIGLNEAATSVVGSRHLITKVYFPRLVDSARGGARRPGRFRRRVRVAPRR